MSTENRLAGLGFDPADCDNMTIHEPGSIQPHGALLVLCPEDLKVIQVSLATEAVEIAAPRVAEAGAEVVIGSLPTVLCDRGWVREVLVNLITNALKYNDKAQKRVEIGVAPRRAAGDLPAIFVRDNGIGIAERHKDAVFAMFKRLHGPSEYGGGTGAGLAIARKIIERHGGRVWLESTPGGGSTFFFTLDAGERPA